MHIGFQQLAAQLSGKPGVTNPKGAAAAIGRKKYGGSKMAAAARGGKPLSDAQALKHRPSAAQRRKHRRRHAKPPMMPAH